MAERRLNFNSPLLSTRRMQKTAISVRTNKPHYFTDDSNAIESSSAPIPIQITKSASVPFTWEQSPGRLRSNDFKPQICDTTQEVVVVTPCLPPGKVMDILKSPMEKDYEAFDGNMARLQSSNCKQAEESSDDDKESDDVFSDALDTLSPLNSCSINHSISGVSGYGVVGTKKPPTLSDDPQSRDFMLNRFLPAAKAMTVETPQYALKRRPLSCMSESTRQIRDIVLMEKSHTPNRYDESFFPPYYHQDIDSDESEDDDDEDGVSESAYLSKRGCGMLSHLCFKDSLRMLHNTVPGLKPRHNSPITSFGHEQVKSSKVSQLKSRFQSVKKLAHDSVSKNKLGGRVQSPVHRSVGKKLNLGSEQLGSNSNLTAAAVTRTSSPYRQSGSMSPFRSVGNSSPFHSAGFPETRRETEDLRANRLNKHIRNISTSHELLYPKSTTVDCLSSSVMEKTVYVDTENSPKTSDRHNSMIMIVSEEAGKGGKKSEAILEAFENGKMVKGDELEDIDNQSPLAPPSPKKPSESWLLRNLPSVTTSQIPSRRFPFNPQKQNLEENSKSVIKWETIVKTSHMHRDHIRYSEELLATTSRQSKT